MAVHTGPMCAGWARAVSHNAGTWCDCGGNPVAEEPGHGYGRGAPDAIFAHRRLAAVYDAFDGPRDDLAAYVEIAGELGADRVLDVGCGTGCLAVLLARAGRTVVAVDPAAASLDVARSKDTGEAVTWVHGDATQVPAVGADLAVMTGNVAQVFLADEDWAQALQAIGAALRPRGYLVFETRRPAGRAWEDWAAQTSPVVLDVPGSGLVEQRRQVTAVDLPFVSFRCTYTFRADGAVIASDSTLGFRGREEVESSLPPRATGRWMSGKPQTGRATSSCSSPSAQPEPARPPNARTTHCRTATAHITPLDLRRSSQRLIQCLTW